MKKKQMKKIVNLIFVFLIVIVILWLIIDDNEYKIEEKEIKNTVIIPQTSLYENIVIEKTLKRYPKVDVIRNYNGYAISAFLEIPKINLKTYVLENYSEQALKVSVTKFWGKNPNEIGNFCIAGHNFKNKNMFYNLKNLSKGDKLYLSDNKIGKVEYEIYDLYKVIPEDVSCLSQLTNGKREITLITCTSDSQKRIIVKAKENV